MKGRKHSDKTKKLMREKRAKQVFSEQDKQAMRNAQLGKKQLKEQVEKRAAKLRGRKRPDVTLNRSGKDNPIAKAVLCITTNEQFDTITEASRKFGIPTTNISKVCKGLRPHAKQLKFKYI